MPFIFNPSVALCCTIVLQCPRPIKQPTTFKLGCGPNLTCQPNPWLVGHSLFMAILKHPQARMPMQSAQWNTQRSNLSSLGCALACQSDDRTQLALGASMTGHQVVVVLLEREPVAGQIFLRDVDESRDIR